MKTPPAEAFAHFFVQNPIPVFLQTTQMLLELEKREDISSSDLSDVILHDPFFTLHIIKYLAENPSKRRITDITTVNHSIMMLGIEPFFQHFSSPPIVEDRTLEFSTLTALYEVARRSYIAGQLALRFAKISKDMEPEEIQVAALLHDIAEMLLWLIFPQKANSIAQLMIQKPEQRSHLLQQQILSFPLIEVELFLCQQLHLPQLLVDLISNRHTSPTPFHFGTPRRMKAVMLAVRLTRHMSKSFQDPGLLDDFTDISSLLNTSLDPNFCIQLQNLALSHAFDWESKYCKNHPIKEFGNKDPFFIPT